MKISAIYRNDKDWVKSIIVSPMTVTASHLEACQKLIDLFYKKRRRQIFEHSRSSWIPRFHRNDLRHLEQERQDLQDELHKKYLQKS